MTDDTKALPADVAGLIAELRSDVDDGCPDCEIKRKAADALERLTAPLGPEVERTKTAIALLNLYEGLDADAEYGTRLPSWLDMEHDGDCTKKPYTCSHCLADNFLAMADKLIAYVGRTPLQNLGPEVEEIEARRYGMLCRCGEDVFDASQAVKDRDFLIDRLRAEVAGRTKYEAALLRIEELEDSERDDPLDDAIRIARKALGKAQR